MMTQPADEELLVHNWRVGTAHPAGRPGALAEVYAEHLDWHQVTRLVQRLTAAAGAAHRRLTSELARRRRE